MKPPASTKLVIDRIEGDLAVLVLYDDDSVKFDLPLRSQARVTSLMTVESAMVWRTRRIWPWPKSPAAFGTPTSPS